MATKTSDTVFTCVMPYSTDGPDGEPVTFREGHRLESSDPAVARHPDFWAREDKPSEIEAKRRAAWLPAHTQTYDDTSKMRVTTIKYRAKRKVRLELDGELREIKRGDLVSYSDPVVVVAPGAFQKVSIEG